MNTSELHARIDALFDQHLEAVKEFIRMPSISHTGEGMAATAAFCQELIAELGGTSTLEHVGGEYPIVYGRLDVGSNRTIAMYGMYDVQPADEDDWMVEPFAAEVRELPGLGECIVARGAVNTKAPLRAFFNVLELLVEAGSLPFNVIFMIEGEEERGSASMPPFVAKYAEELAEAEAILFPFFTQEANGDSVFNLGVKGAMHFELVSKGGDWGGPRSHDVHGGQASWIASPAWRLVSALATLVDADERIIVPGFYDDVIPPTPEDEELLAALETKQNLPAQLSRYDAARFKHEGSVTDQMRHLLFDPTLNISGLFSGYTGPGFKTLLPHKATARIDIRLVPGMKPERVIELVRQHLDDSGFPDIEVTAGGYQASKIPVTNPFAQAALRTYERHGHQPAVWPILHGCAPFYLFTDVLNRPLIMCGLGHGARQHSSNEYITVEGIRDFEKSMVTLIEEFAAVPTGAASTVVVT